MHLCDRAFMGRMRQLRGLCMRHMTLCRCLSCHHCCCCSPACRVADGSMSMERAKQLNQEHYKRFYGKPMPKEMFF